MVAWDQYKSGRLTGGGGGCEKNVLYLDYGDDYCSKSIELYT